MKQSLMIDASMWREQWASLPFRLCSLQSLFALRRVVERKSNYRSREDSTIRSVSFLWSCLEMTPDERFCYQSCKYLELNDPPLDSLNSIFSRV